MSWFGDHLSSFTEKISDFTKDMLPDSGSNSAAGDQPLQNDNPPSQSVFDPTKEKDAEINMLRNEKALLEKSIEELELQHQEAVNTLLELKNEAVKENVTLKDELNVQRELNSTKSFFQKFEHKYNPAKLKIDQLDSTTETMHFNSMKGFNLVNIIGVLWNNFGASSLNSVLKWLEEQKLLLENQTVNVDDSSFKGIISRINNYIMLLQLMSKNPDLFFPLVDEIARVMQFLLSGENSKFSIPDDMCNESFNVSSSSSCNKVEIADTQVFINDLSDLKDLFSKKSEQNLCNNATRVTADSEKKVSSSQLENSDSEVKNCCSLTAELEEYIVQLEQEKSKLEADLSEFQEQVSNLQEQLQSQEKVPSSAAFVEDKNVENDGPITESEISVQSSSAVQTDNFHDVDCDTKIIELETYVSILEQEKSDYEDKILELENVVNKCTLSVPTQTEGFTCDCNVHELETQICILEQDKSDLAEKITIMESTLNKPKQSIHIQTEENSNLNQILQSEIEGLQEILNLKENEYNNYHQEIRRNINNLEEELQVKDFLLQEKDNVIQSLEEDLVNCKNQIQELTTEIPQTASLTSAEVQTDEDNCSSKLYKLEISDLKRTLEEREKEYNEIQNQTILSVNKLTTELNACTSLVADKDSKLNILNNELETCKMERKGLSEELITLRETSLNERDKIIAELNTYISLVTEKDSKLDTLNDELETCKIEINNLNEELTTLKESSLDEKGFLTTELNTYISLETEKDSKLNTLNDELETCKIEIKSLTEELTTLRQTSLDKKDESCSSCSEYEIKLNKLNNHIREKENEFATTNEDLNKNIDNLTNKLNSFESLISEKDSMLQGFQSQVENYKGKINDLKNELIALKNVPVLKSDTKCTSCVEYQTQLQELKMYIGEKENEFSATENDLLSSINNLKEFLEGKDCLINDKEEMIQLLKLELAEAKISIKNHLGDLKALKEKQDYAKDIDTMEDCDIKMVMGNCNRCKSILNGDSSDNDLRNEIRVLQDKLKALDMDKNQLLCVLNEKTQECSSLKNEVHKLTNIVASEKQALFKLQQDNCILRESRSNADPELTKEAVQKLSHIIRDKDLEIESLKQKNITLTALIQDTSSVPDHMQSLIEEKENLTKQINVFKADRDKIMVRYNTIDKDCRHYAAEVKNLQSALSEQKEKFDILEQKHFSVAQQYEEKQKSLINSQNEMIALKQRVSDLEQQQFDIKEKYSQLLNKFNSDTMVQLTKDELDEKNSQIEQLISANSEKDHLIQEKDCLIHDLSQQIKTLKLEHEQQLTNLTNLQAKTEELTSKLKEYEVLVDQHKNEKEALELRFQDKNSELDLLKGMNERLNMSHKEKEFTIQSMTEKISSLSHYISSDHTTSDTVDINQILADSESLFSKAQSLYKERDETLLALNQSKQDNQSLRNEIQRMKSNEIHLKKELERLRLHLLEIEENYTAEALKSEEREKELRDELVEVRRRAEISNTAIVDTNQRASIQIASLQEQLTMIANQRDQALAQVSTLEDKVQQHSASISKLQLVLEQMQRGNERKIKEAEKKYIVQLENQRKLHKELEEKLQARDMQLAESTQALEAASRLSEQLDAKEEIIANLKSELSKTESKFKSTAQEIDTIKSNTEGKVDRVVMKSLVLGYFSTPPGQKSEVIRLLARVLDFNQEEMEKAGIVVGRNAQKIEQRGLFSSIFGRLPTLSSDRSPVQSDKSFTTLFVQFLENESQPIVPMPFPVEKMAHDQITHFKQHPNKKSPTIQKKTISRNNPLLLDIDSAFPTFTPVPAVEYSEKPAPSILREVLE